MSRSPSVIVPPLLPHDVSAAWHNRAILNHTLATMQPGDTVAIPRKVYHIMGGVAASRREAAASDWAER